MLVEVLLLMPQAFLVGTEALVLLCDLMMLHFCCPDCISSNSILSIWYNSCSSLPTHIFANHVILETFISSKHHGVFTLQNLDFGTYLSCPGNMCRIFMVSHNSSFFACFNFYFPSRSFSSLKSGWRNKYLRATAKK